MKNQVLVIDDDDRMLRMLRRLLNFAGYSVKVALTGSEGLELAAEHDPDLVILDIMLPGMDGLTVCRQMRARSATPILMLTALGTSDDCVAGLDAGADDYLTKPFSVDELLARVRALLRRTRVLPHLLVDPPTVLEYEDLTLHTGMRQARRGEYSVDLGMLEFRLLRLFLLYPEQVLSREQLVDGVWGSEYDHTSDVLAALIYGLRLKLEQGDLPRLIHTLRGSGYILRR